MIYNGYQNVLCPKIGIVFVAKSTLLLNMRASLNMSAKCFVCVCAGVHVVFVPKLTCLCQFFFRFCIVWSWQVTKDLKQSKDWLYNMPSSSSTNLSFYDDSWLFSPKCLYELLIINWNSFLQWLIVRAILCLGNLCHCGSDPQKQSIMLLSTATNPGDALSCKPCYFF